MTLPQKIQRVNLVLLYLLPRIYESNLTFLLTDYQHRNKKACQEREREKCGVGYDLDSVLREKNDKKINRSVRNMLSKWLYCWCVTALLKIGVLANISDSRQ